MTNELPNEAALYAATDTVSRRNAMDILFDREKRILQRHDRNTQL